MIEILIAMFIFLIGILGVLSMFPVAMISAARSIGQVRANILAQSVLAQLTADCRVVYETGDCAANASLSPEDELKRAISTDDWTDYYVTLTAGSGKWQSRRIVGIDAADNTILLIDPTTQWTTVGAWTAPGQDAADEYVITRLGLPDAPVTGAPVEFGLERDFYVRQIIGEDTIELGRLDTLDPVKGTATGSSGTTLEDNTQNWTADLYNNCTVLLLSGAGAGQQRLITDTEETPRQLTVSPAWDVNPVADDTTYEILSINPIKYDSGDLEAAGSTATTGTLTDNEKTWTDNEFVDHLVRITAGNAVGQVRRIRSNTSNTLTLSSPWVPEDPNTADADTDAYVIGWPDNTLLNDGFVVVTSGRAEGRVYGITGSAITGGGYQVICGDASLREVGVTEAQRAIDATAYPNNEPYKYKPNDATTVTVIGNSGHLRSVLPTAQDGPLNYANQINTFGTAGPNQTAYDVFGATDEYGSEYSVVAVFSDSGTLPEGPVRVDVLVFRNFDNMTGVAENKKPVGFLTGYIGRP